MATAQEPDTRRRESRTTFWLADVWGEFRPYLVRLFTDFLIFVTIWLILLAAHALTNWFPLGTTLSLFLIGFHETVIVLTFVWLSLEATWDMVMLRRKRER